MKERYEGGYWSIWTPFALIYAHVEAINKLILHVHVHLLLVILNNIKGKKQKWSKASSKKQQEYIRSFMIISNIIINDSGNAWKDIKHLPMWNQETGLEMSKLLMIILKVRNLQNALDKIKF